MKKSSNEEYNRKIQDQLTQLKKEIRILNKEDETAKERLEGIAGELEELLSRQQISGGGKADVLDSMQDAAEQFEVKHPAITRVLNQIAMTLSNMGI